MIDLMRLIHGINIYQNFDHTKFNYKHVGWNSEHPIFEKLIKTTKPKLIIELGSWYGMSAIHMASIIKKEKLTTKILCIDTWLGSLEFIGLQDTDHNRQLYPINGYPSAYYQFLSNIKYNQCEDIIIPFPQTTTLGCRWLSKYNINAEMIYVDGSNELTDVYNDIKFAWPILTPNGIIFGDDYNHAVWPGIAIGVNKFCAERLLSPTIFDIFWTLEKKHIS